MAFFIELTVADRGAVAKIAVNTDQIVSIQPCPKNCSSLNTSVGCIALLGVGLSPKDFIDPIELDQVQLTHPSLLDHVEYRALNTLPNALQISSA